jgi:general secretion pathway protein H
MPTSVPGSSPAPRRARRSRPPGATAPRLRGLPRPVRGLAVRARGFTLVELLVVLMLVALSSSLVMLALRDGSAARLDEDGVRLAALLEAARAESRVSGLPVHWVPLTGTDARDAAADPTRQAPQFRFVGLSGVRTLPQRWLDEAVIAEVEGANAVLLGPEAILPPQRITLRLGEHSLALSSDGLGPFVIAAPEAAP